MGLMIEVNIVRTWCFCQIIVASPILPCSRSNFKTSVRQAELNSFHILKLKCTRIQSVYSSHANIQYTQNTRDSKYTLRHGYTVPCVLGTYLKGCRPKIRLKEDNLLSLFLAVDSNSFLFSACESGNDEIYSDRHAQYVQ